MCLQFVALSQSLETTGLLKVWKMKSVGRILSARNVRRSRMFRLLALGEEDVAALAHHGAEGMSRFRDCRRPLS